MEALRTILVINFIGCPDIHHLALSVDLVEIVFTLHTKIIKADAAKVICTR